MVDGMTIHVAMPFRIYVKAIFVSLLVYFIDNKIDLKNKMEKNEKKTTQLERFHNPIDKS